MEVRANDLANPWILTDHHENGGPRQSDEPSQAYLVLSFVGGGGVGGGDGGGGGDI